VDEGALRRAGVRSLGPLVDVTNYVMLELGQPMHAFDLGRLTGGIEVRRARPGDRLELLNGAVVEPDAETLLIADQHGPLALAGIMGGEISSCTDATRDVFLESAFFTPASIAGRARRYGLANGFRVSLRAWRGSAIATSRRRTGHPVADRHGGRPAGTDHRSGVARASAGGAGYSLAPAPAQQTARLESPLPRSKTSCAGWAWRCRLRWIIGWWFRPAAASILRWKWI
jgi:hypothetical protein